MVNKSCNISKTTTTNQCKRVLDLWRPGHGSVKIKRYYAKNGRLWCLSVHLSEVQVYLSESQSVYKSFIHPFIHSVSQSVKLTLFVHQQVMSSATFQFYRTRFKQ